MFRSIAPGARVGPRKFVIDRPLVWTTADGIGATAGAPTKTMIPKYLALLSLCCLCGTMRAGVYYIDYVSGDDANAGTSKTSPWKRAPGMNGWTGKHAHSAGDRFIFKGGVTWPASCFQWKVTWSGKEGAPDYYGADTNWYSGASFKKPLFDFEKRVINGWTAGAGVLFQGVNWAVIDNLEMARHAAPLGKKPMSNWGAMTICLDTCNNITLSNSIIRDWTMPNVNGVIESGTSGGGGIQKVNAGSNLTAVDCEFHQRGSDVVSGSALWNIVTVERCHIHHCASAIMSANVVRSCHIHDLKKPSDPAAHSNVMLNYGANKIINNHIHDIDGVAQVIYISPGAYGAGDTLICGNLVYRVRQPSVALDTGLKNDQGQKTRVFNNTLEGAFGTGPCIRVGHRNNGPFAYLEARNNHFITSGETTLINNPNGGGAKVTTFLYSNNLTNTPRQAAAAGYTAANLYAPLDGRRPTVDAGMDLSVYLKTDIKGNTRPDARSGKWDIGAYEWTSGPPRVTALE